uniref:Serine/threonine protein phosphatase 2A regulatory subunit n=1 Tax=Kalanchoe fedtschenkoi TaxID=63787 RepID=A0A7N0ZTU8_KALFE
MLKKILSKLPQKSAKSLGSDSPPSELKSSGNSEIKCIAGAKTSLSGLNVVKRMSAAIFPTSMTSGMEIVDPNLSFNDVPNSVKQNLCISKLNLCCVIHEELLDTVEKVTKCDLKHQALIELAEYLSSGSAKFNESAIAAICKMCAVNLFRVFPPKNRSSSGGGEIEDDQPVFDPSWSDLEIVYELLLRFVSYSSLDIKVARKYVDSSFILQLLDLFDSEDPRERECLKTILHRIYAKFMAHRPFIRCSVSNIIYRFVYETERHNGIAELLEIFGCIISGFSSPLSSEHIAFLSRALMPLHKPKSLGTYHQELTYCVVQFIEKDQKLASTVVEGLLKFWPVTSSQKQLMFLSEIEEVLETCNMVGFQKVMVPLFRRLSSCINSSHYQVAERALLLLNNERYISLIMHNREAILPLVIPALEQNANNHWNRTVVNLSLNIKKIYVDLDQRPVACKPHEDNLNAENQRSVSENLESAAGVHPVARDFPALVAPSAC